MMALLVFRKFAHEHKPLKEQCKSNTYQAIELRQKVYEGQNLDCTHEIKN